MIPIFKFIYIIRSWNTLGLQELLKRLKLSCHTLSSTKWPSKCADPAIHGPGGGNLATTQTSCFWSTWFLASSDQASRSRTRPYALQAGLAPPQQVNAGKKTPEHLPFPVWLISKNSPRNCRSLKADPICLMENSCQRTVSVATLNQSPLSQILSHSRLFLFPVLFLVLSLLLFPHKREKKKALNPQARGSGFCVSTSYHAPCYTCVSHYIL